MIDTFSATFSAHIESKLLEELKRGHRPEWKLISDGHKRVGKHMETRTVLVHAGTGLRASLNDGFLTRIEVEFPRLVPLCPERQCRSEDDMLFRWENLYRVLDTLGPNIRDRMLKITRLDLALTLNLDPRPVLALHRNACHPGVRRETERYYNDRPGQSRSGQVPYKADILNSVVFNGVHTRISLYDKVAQVCKHRSEVPEVPTGLRVEIQLKGTDRIGKAFGKQKGESVAAINLTLANCYRVYRTILSEFDGLGGMVAPKLNTVGLIAILERCPASRNDLGGMYPLDAYRLYKKLSDERFRQLRREVKDVQFRLAGFRWTDVLPIDSLPKTAEIGEGGQFVLYDAVPLTR